MSSAKLEVRVRFAPSPTGYLHVGGARTALFNWLFARHFGGKFVLRIEDTDTERSSPEMVDGILEGLKWLGLDWDEGPFFQSQRLDRYRGTAQRLVQAGTAYACFCSLETLNEKKNWKYDGTCRQLSQEEIEAKEAKCVPSVIRFKVPLQGKIRFEDQVLGIIEHDLENLEDFVLLRSDGMPTYHLGVVVDDIDMKISHVIRGADHISNTPKQVLLYQALQQVTPLFAHVPLILGPDKSRLSKRHGATSVTTYRDQGYLPEAFRNFLALLGWSSGQGTEKMSSKEMIERFSLEGINKSNAVFDLDKLGWFNSVYLDQYPAEGLYPLVRTELEKTGLWEEEYETSRRKWFLDLLDLLKSRTRLLPDFVSMGRPFLCDQFETEPEAIKKFLKDESLKILLPELAVVLGTLPEFTLQSTELALRSFADQKQVKAGVLINGSRVLLTGRAASPPIFDVMVMLGQKRTVERLRKNY
ncbi:MAG TPA: glutamate--tRNA ligase [Terriglobia bacterium]|nr:glutamate--tRNA ligase [Terriglobia bacterium]